MAIFLHTKAAIFSGFQLLVFLEKGTRALCSHVAMAGFMGMNVNKHSPGRFHGSPAQHAREEERAEPRPARR